MALDDLNLRDSPLDGSEDDEPTFRQALLWFLNRELAPVVRSLLGFVGVSWGSTVDVSESRAVEVTDEFLRCDATSGEVTLTLLPSAKALEGVRLLTIKRLNNTGGNVTWAAQGDDDVDGSTTDSLTAQYELVRLKPREGGYDIA